TGNPKGVVYHHRVHALCDALAQRRRRVDQQHVHDGCAAVVGDPLSANQLEYRLGVDTPQTDAGTCVCRQGPRHAPAVAVEHRQRPQVRHVWRQRPSDEIAGRVQVCTAMVAGAAPPAAMIEGMDRIGFELTHVYGLTETYGPAAVCAPQEDWAELDIVARAQRHSRQGVTYPLQEAMAVLDPDTMRPVPADGATMGEIMFRGNITMKGYLKNPRATEEAFKGGWFHSGDLAVVEPDGYVKIKDRSKDIIISGGENISSLEVEDVLYRHPAVLACAVIARPDERWGETPCAYVEIKADAQVTAEELIGHCRAQLAHFKAPRHIEFATLPKTSTGKIQKAVLRAAEKAALSANKDADAPSG
ncbi:MAG: AMP-binding protein, partial [Proteobacteria bacterium]|nr:AMP-binding protein [Pseudomonadota bacterium]